MKSIILVFAIYLIFCVEGRSQDAILSINSPQTYTWGSLGHYYPKDSIRCLSHVKVETTLGKKIVFTIEWNDEIIDSKRIPPEIRRWKDPEGKIRDKDLMYFFDGLGVRLYYKDQFYEGWIRPLSKKEWQVQWENAGSMKTRTSSPVQILNLSWNDALEQLEMTIDYEEIEWDLRPDEDLKITLIAADADTPEIDDISERIVNGLSYCHSTKEFEIKN